MAEKVEAVAAVKTKAAPLEAGYDLSEGEIAALGLMFRRAMAEIGLDGDSIFERLKEGRPLFEVLGLSRNTVDALYTRAHQWFMIGRHDKAEGLFRTLCLLDPKVADHWIGYGVCLKLNGALDVAAQAFEFARALRPDWAIPHFHLLSLAIRRCDWAAAERELQAFEAGGQGDVPAAIASEVSKYRRGLSLQREKLSRGADAVDAEAQ